MIDTLESNHLALICEIMVAGSQKGLMTPPGLGFMYFNQRVIEAREMADLVTPYWDLLPRINPEVFYEYF